MNQNVILSQDGWSSVSQDPILASNVFCNGKTYPLDFHEAGSSNKKTAEYCFQLAKESIKLLEEKYSTTVIAFVSDNEAKMCKVRSVLEEWHCKDAFFMYGCSAHYTNLVESMATPPQLIAKIIEVNKFFHNHHQPNF